MYDGRLPFFVLACNVNWLTIRISPSTSFTEEVGELARIMARKYGDQSFKKSDEQYNMADEMADVLWVLVCLANQTGVDLNEAFLKNMEKKSSRDKERHQNNFKLR